MKMNVTRRDVLRFGAGGVVGAMLTPAPWKALDDVAIWTQNWSWIPRPPKGPSTMRATVCALCPAGCAASARCIGGLPVSMRAASADAGLCLLGLTAHHLPYHPARTTRPVRIVHDGARVRRVPVPIDSIISATSRAIIDARLASRTVAVLDTRPGRSVSWAWQRLLGAIPNAVYVPAPGREGAALTTLQQIVGTGDAIGLDFENVKTIISFRAPLAEGWGTPSGVTRALAAGANLIQVDPVRTRTADIANRWLPVKPGTEGVLANAIARELLGASPLASSLSCGIPQAEIAALARDLAQNGPSLAISDEGLGRDAEESIQALNVAMKNSAIVPRAELPAPFAEEALAPNQEIDRVADGSISLLIIDATAGDVRFPWSVVQQKLDRNALVVALSPFFAGTVQNANYIVPTLPHLETLGELPTPFDAPAPQLAIAAPLLPPRHQAFDPAAFIRAVARTSSTELPGEGTKSEELMRARVSAIHANGEGSITANDGSTKSIKDLGSPDEMWDALVAGGRWEGKRSRTRIESGRGVQSASFDKPAEAGQHNALMLVVRVPRDVNASGAVSPVMTKLYRESDLRQPAGTAVINPATARQIGLAAGRTARLETAGGACRVAIATDHAVMPGVIEVTSAPEAIALGDVKAENNRNVLDIVKPDAAGCWRTVAARLVVEA